MIVAFVRAQLPAFIPNKGCSGFYGVCSSFPRELKGEVVLLVKTFVYSNNMGKEHKSSH